MKKVVSIAAIALFALSFASCKKCIECCTTATGASEICGNEFCGNKDDIKKTEDDFDAACAILKAFDPGMKCECRDV